MNQNLITFTVTLASADTTLTTHTISLPGAHGRTTLEDQITRAGADLSAHVYAALVQHLTGLGHCAPGLIEEPDATPKQRRIISNLWAMMEGEEMDWYCLQAGQPRRPPLTYAGTERLIAALRAELDGLDASRPFRPIVQSPWGLEDTTPGPGLLGEISYLLEGGTHGQR